MKVGAVSGDLLVKLALGALLVGAGVWAVRRALGAANDANDAIVRAALAAVDTVNPLNPNNVFASGANAAVSAATGRPETLGGWLYSATHPDPVRDAPRDYSDGAMTNSAGMNFSLF